MNHEVWTWTLELELIGTEEDAMDALNIHRMMTGLSFRKSAAELRPKMRDKLGQIKAKVEERIGRVAMLRQEYGIDDAALIQLLQAARKAEKDAQQWRQSYSFFSTSAVGARTGDREGQPAEERFVGAGVVQNLLTESDFIEAEKTAIARLELMERNLVDVERFTTTGAPLPSEGFSVTLDDLQFLGF